MKTFHRLHKQAFTLIEIILYIGLTSVVLTFVAGFAVQIWSDTNTVDKAAKSHAELTIAIERMSRGFQEAEAIVSAQSVFKNISSKIVFKNRATGANDTLELSPAGSGILQFTRSTGIVDPLLTSEVSVEEFWAELKSLPKRPTVLYIRILPKGSTFPFETILTVPSLYSI